MTAHPAERAGLLGTPLRVGRAVLRNRIVSPPMERNYCTVDGAPTPRYLAYLRARAAGGAALLFTGATPSWSSGWPTGPLLELEAPGAAGGDVAELARRHIATLDEYGVTGGYRLAGWAFGGVVAMEMAGQLERRGDPVDLVMLYGCAAPDRYRPGRPVRGRVVVIAAGELGDGSGPALGWDRWTTGELVIRSMPGDQSAMTTEPSVAALAEIVDDELSRLDI